MSNLRCQFFYHLYKMIVFLNISLGSCFRRNDNWGAPMCLYYIELGLNKTLLVSISYINIILNLAKALNMEIQNPPAVIPAKAGTQGKVKKKRLFEYILRKIVLFQKTDWVPAFAGMTTGGWQK